MERHWVPLLLSNAPIDDFDHRRSSAFERICNLARGQCRTRQADGICGPVHRAYVVDFRSLRERGATACRSRASAGSGIHDRSPSSLPDLRSKVIQTDPTTAALIAIEGLPDRSSGRERPFVVEAERQLYDAYASTHERHLMRGPSKAIDVRKPGEGPPPWDHFCRWVACCLDYRGCPTATSAQHRSAWRFSRTCIERGRSIRDRFRRQRSECLGHRRGSKSFGQSMASPAHTGKRHDKQR